MKGWGRKVLFSLSVSSCQNQHPLPHNFYMSPIASKPRKKSKAKLSPLPEKLPVINQPLYPKVQKKKAKIS